MRDFMVRLVSSLLSIPTGSCLKCIELVPGDGGIGHCFEVGQKVRFGLSPDALYGCRVGGGWRSGLMPC